MTSVNQGVFSKIYKEAEELINEFNDVIEDFDYVFFKISSLKEGAGEQNLSDLDNKINRLKNILDFLKDCTDIKHTENLDKYSKEIDERKSKLDGIKRQYNKF